MLRPKTRTGFAIRDLQIECASAGLELEGRLTLVDDLFKRTDDDGGLDLTVKLWQFVILEQRLLRSSVLLQSLA